MGFILVQGLHVGASRALRAKAAPNSFNIKNLHPDVGKARHIAKHRPSRLDFNSIALLSEVDLRDLITTIQDERDYALYRLYNHFDDTDYKLGEHMTTQIYVERDTVYEISLKIFALLEEWVKLKTMSC